MELERAFQRGFERRPRKHQVEAVAALWEAIRRGERRLLAQHAPGSGKTETIGLLAWEALRHANARMTAEERAGVGAGPPGAGAARGSP